MNLDDCHNRFNRIMSVLGDGYKWYEERGVYFRKSKSCSGRGYPWILVMFFDFSARLDVDVSELDQEITVQKRAMEKLKELRDCVDDQIKKLETE